MIKRTLSAIMITAALLFTASCSQEVPTTEVGPIELSGYNISVDAPTEWIDRNEAQGSGYLITSLSGDNVSFKVTDAAGYGGNLQTWKDSIKERLFTTDSGRKIVSEGSFTANSFNGYKWVYTDAQGLTYVMRILVLSEGALLSHDGAVGAIFSGSTDVSDNADTLNSILDSVQINIAEADKTPDTSVPTATPDVP